MIVNWSCYIHVALRRATFDKFGEEGLKAGVTIAEGGMTQYGVYVFVCVTWMYTCIL